LTVAAAAYSAQHHSCELQTLVRCPSVTGWKLGGEAVTALVALLQPCPNLDGSWEVLPSLTELGLEGE
jgi:hypothetical protein